MPGSYSRGGETKESIVLFCRILKYSGIYRNLSPDDVRLAKFDKPEVIPQLSKVLHAILEQGSSASEQARDEFLSESLKKLKYPRLIALFDKFGKICSSRETLLAIAWFIHIDKTVERVKNDALRPVDIRELMLETLELGRKNDLPANPEENKSLSDKVSQMTWILSRINLMKQQILSIESGNIKKKIKIGSQLRAGLSDNPLLVLALRNPSLGAQYEKCVEQRILLLQSCLQWRKVESVFWLWMNSVLDNAPQMDSANTNEEMTRDPRISLPLSVFETTLETLTKELERQRNSFNRSDAEAISARLQPEQKLEISNEIAALRSRLLSLHHEPSLRPLGDRRTHIPPNGSLPLQVEIESLAESCSSISAELDECRSLAREKLQDISTKFNRIVLIAPEVPRNKS